MTTEVNVASREKRKHDVVLMLVLGALAAVVYGMTLARDRISRRSAALMAVYSGIEPLQIPVHPIWGTIVSWQCSLSFWTLPASFEICSTLFRWFRWC
jgi:hypothetical protein